MTNTNSIYSSVDVGHGVSSQILN